MLLLIALTLTSTPVAADRIMAAYRERTRVERACRAAVASGEIVVCGKRGSVYRLPFREPDAGSRAAIAADAFAERRRLHGRAVDAGGIGSCSTVGPGGATGCTKGLGIVSVGGGRTSFLPRPIDD